MKAGHAGTQGDVDVPPATRDAAATGGQRHGCHVCERPVGRDLDQARRRWAREIACHEAPRLGRAAGRAAVGPARVAVVALLAAPDQAVAAARRAYAGSAGAGVPGLDRTDDAAAVGPGRVAIVAALAPGDDAVAATRRADARSASTRVSWLDRAHIAAAIPGGGVPVVAGFAAANP